MGAQCPTQEDLDKAMQLEDGLEDMWSAVPASMLHEKFEFGGLLDSGSSETEEDDAKEAAKEDAKEDATEKVRKFRDGTERNAAAALRHRCYSFKAAYHYS